MNDHDRAETLARHLTAERPEGTSVHIQGDAEVQLLRGDGHHGAATFAQDPGQQPAVVLSTIPDGEIRATFRKELDACFPGIAVEEVG